MATAILPFISMALPFLLNKIFPGEKAKLQQVPTMDPMQKNLMSQMQGPLQGMNTFLSELMSGSPEAMKRFTDPAMRQFNEQIIPGLAEQFAGSGEMSSGSFKQALGSAGASLAERLQAMRSGMQMQAMGPLSNMMGSTMQAQPFGYQMTPGSQGMGSAMAPGIGYSAMQQMPNALKDIMDLFKSKV